VSAFGTPRELATRVRRILDEIKTIRARNPAPVSQARRNAVFEKTPLMDGFWIPFLGLMGILSLGMYKTSMGMAGLVHGRSRRQANGHRYLDSHLPEATKRLPSTVRSS